jgi:hypothetical protein
MCKYVTINAVELAPKCASTVKPPKMFLKKLNKPGLLSRENLKSKKNRHHPRIGHMIRHNGFVVCILEGAISGKRAVGKPRLRYLKQVTSCQL